MVALEVEALRHRGRGPRRLVQEGLRDPEVGHVLLRLVELDAERVSIWEREVGAGADVLVHTPEWVRAVPGADGLRLSRRRARSGQGNEDSDGGDPEPEPHGRNVPHPNE